MKWRVNDEVMEVMEIKWKYRAKKKKKGKNEEETDRGRGRNHLPQPRQLMRVWGKKKRTEIRKKNKRNKQGVGSNLATWTM